MTGFYFSLCIPPEISDSVALAIKDMQQLFKKERY
jgi:hypothetical protein